MSRSRALLCLAVLIGSLPLAAAEQPTAAQRGRTHLLGKAYNPASMPLANYANAWKHWGAAEPPAPGEEYDRRFRRRYGLHSAPYPNDGLPMGVRKAGANGLTVDCLVCHGGSIFGKSYVGLGNTALDYHLFYEEMTAAPPRRVSPPFVFTRTRGTVEAGGMAVFLLGHRQPDLSLRILRKDLDLKDDLCEDTPAWWLLKKKTTMYYTGGSDSRSVRSIMQFMMSPLNGPAAFDKAEGDFKDILQFIKSIEAPKYPLAVDRPLAARGEAVFKDTCARCHGSYGEKWTYPNKVVPLKDIGTDPRRYHGVTKKFADYYDQSWFGKEHKSLPSDGYQAPPLDGVWATAPYFHNGSVPTLDGVLNSKARPKRFTRSFETGREDYDEKKVGWKVTEAEAPDEKKMSTHEARRVYDTTQPGRGNGGHVYGDRLSDEERAAVIEYLKTL